MQVKTIILFLVLATLLAGCRVGDARSQICNAMRDASKSVTEVSEAVRGSNAVATVGDLRTRLRTIRQKVEIARSVASAVVGADNLRTVINNLNEIDQSLSGTPDNTPLSQVADKIRAPAESLRTSFNSTYDAICAAK